MPSTFSTDLRIELIGNGEQSGTWGTTTNNNLGTLIEDAISGLATVSVTSANQALTAIDGAADEARCAALRLTTTTTANFAIYTPPVTKIYIIQNTTAYTATIYASTVIGNTTAAGTGVEIPSGKTMLVRCQPRTGSPSNLDFVEAISYVSSLEAGDVTLGSRLSATYTQTATTVTVTTASVHGYVNGESVAFINATGDGANGTYTITLINTTSFSFTSPVSQATSGNCFVTNDAVVMGGVVGAGMVVEGSSSIPALRVTQTGSGNAFVVDDETSPDSTSFIIDTNGNVITGNAQALSSWNNSTLTPRVQQLGLTAANGGSGIAVFNATTTVAPTIELAKSIGATLANYSALAADTTLGTLRFSGADGSDFSPAVSIAAFSDGEFNTSGDATDSPGRLVISTAPNGSDTLTERLRINNAGEIIIGAGEASATTTGNTLRAPNRTGTDVAGTNLTIQSGNGTGTGGSGFIALQTAVPSTTGSTANTMVDRLKLSNGVMVGKSFDMDYGVVPVAQYYALNSDYAGANVNTVQSLFGVGVNLAANTIYEFEMQFVLLKTAGAVSHTISLLFNIGSGSINNINYMLLSGFNANPTTALNAPTYHAYFQTATANVISAATTTTTVNYRALIKGTVSVGTAGKWTPQYQLSAAPGGAYSTLAGGFIKIYPVGASGANVNSGGWSA